jgi:integrase
MRANAMSLYSVNGVHPDDWKKPPSDRRKVKIWKYDFEANGRRYAGSFGKVSVTRAKELYRLKRAEALEARHPQPRARRARTVAEVAQEFDAWYCLDVRPSTADTWRVAWQTLAPLIGTRLIRSLTLQDLERVQQQMRRTLKPSTVNHRMGFLRRIIRKAIQWGDLTQNPWEGLRKLREPKKQPRLLATQDEYAILAACNLKLRRVVIAALLTGLRTHELQELRWRHVDLIHRQILIPPEMNKTDTPTSQPISEALAAVLEPMQGAPDDRVFGYKHFRKSYYRVVRRAGITPPPSFHDLRKTFGSRLAQAGENLRTIQELLRHRDIKQTQIYVHLLPSAGQSAVNRLPAPPDVPDSTLPGLGGVLRLVGHDTNSRGNTP